MSEIEYLEFLKGRIEWIIKDLHEESVKYSHLKCLLDDINARLGELKK